MIKEYQEFTHTTAVYPRGDDDGELYLWLGLLSEVGEIAGKIKKEIRDDAAFAKDDRLAEFGDVMWYISELCTLYQLDLDEVLLYNMQKLESRKNRGVIQGAGDNR